jgi:asparagine synthetase B (glutamine-hydrolysing)
MCGIFGFASLDGKVLQAKSFSLLASEMFRCSETRGREAAGIAVVTSDAITVHKDSVPASRMLGTRSYRNFIDGQEQRLRRDIAGDALSSLSFIGHARLVTTGLQAICQNNQPVSHSGAVAVHNGIIVNHQALWDASGLASGADVDSEVLPALVQQQRRNGLSVEGSVAATFSALEGEATAAFLFDDCDYMVVATNTGSLYYLLEANTSFAFTSEYYISKSLAGSSAMSGLFVGQEVRHLEANSGMLISLKTLETEVFSLTERSFAKSSVAPLLATQRRVEQRHELEQKRRRSMQRCSKCLLPETMPFITYDTDGVCNYCRNYKPVSMRGRDALEEQLAPYRGRNEIGDCLVAFSGGRDSSYGLHLLKTEFDMRPVAYTYDWGMVTDLARRNQARICGNLGVEHIWVSADIKKKRSFIRSNVEAWIKRPSLGTVPLFMAGDKQFFWFANKTMKQTGIPLMVFCMNNLERTDFKAGFAGVRPARFDSTNWMLSPLNRLRIAGYYGKDFLLNPRYLNRSLIDTMTAFLSYYFIEKNYVYLFDYLEWHEEEVNDTLIRTYDWETAPDTNSTWRIGDGTAPFYNFIYYTVAGFTEHDTFRSNEIREGRRSRKNALALVEEENRPRWKSIREYLQIINADFDEVVRVVDSIPKLYMEEPR